MLLGMYVCYERQRGDCPEVFFALRRFHSPSTHLLVQTSTTTTTTTTKTTTKTKTKTKTKTTRTLPHERSGCTIDGTLLRTYGPYVRE